MGAGRRNQFFTVNESEPTNLNLGTNLRNLRKGHLGGVIFGCKHGIIKECLHKQLFGLPPQHFSYVKNIEPGLPLFLFNYSDRKLHGIYEAASSGQMNIDPYGWTRDGSQKTQYPAQVQIRVRVQCRPLLEDQFRPIIADNYYNPSHFWFELDHAQTSKLLSLLSSLPNYKTESRHNLFQALPSSYAREEGEVFKGLASELDYAQFGQISKKSGFHSSDGESQLGGDDNDSDIVYMKLKSLASYPQNSDSGLMCYGEDIAIMNDIGLEEKGFMDDQLNEKGVESADFSSDLQSVVAKLLQEVEELKAFKREQNQRMGYIEQKLAQSEIEIQQLRDRHMVLESVSSIPSVTCISGISEEPVVEFNMHDDLIYLIGGYDGESWLSSMDAYSPSRDLIKMLRPMNIPRSYASTAKLNGEIYVFGGGVGETEWYDTVESYNPADNEWVLRPSLNFKKGSLAGATLNNKMFAVGGGDGEECFSSVEMF